MTRDIETAVQIVEQTIVEALRQNDSKAFIAMGRVSRRRTTIDGNFNLTAVARKIVKALAS